MAFFKKDLLLFWRDRKGILMALFLPIILIVVLNLAFSGLFNKEEKSVSIDAAIVLEDDESAGLEQFAKKVQEKDLSPVEKETMLEQAALLAPANLIHDFFNEPELKEWVSSQVLSETDAMDLVKSGELDAIIKIPEGFTYEVLSSLLLGEESEVALTIQAEEQSKEVDALQDIVGNFVNTLNLQFALGRTAGAGMAEPELPLGGREVVEGVETFTFSQYFTIAISTLFALFLSQTVAIKTITEKRERVFNRVVLSNSNPIHFLMGKIVSTFCLTWVQMMITITVTQLLLDVFPGKSFEFWLGLILMITVFALAVAGLSALFTTITLNLNDSKAASGLFTLIIMLLGVLGGSFFPIQGLPELFQRIGEWTPNGLTQTVLIRWIQFSAPQDLWLPIILLIVFFTVCFVIGVSTFPRRERI